jgi:3-phosphoshikimate 1-carboxyvinyltransferase
MNVKVFPSKLAGDIKAIPSKSAAHRALICEFLAGESGGIKLGDFSSKDIEATKNCLDILRNTKGDVICLPVSESGSTYRFLIPVVAALGKKAEWVLAGRLPERPLLPLFEDLAGGKPLNAGVFELNAGISSQFISGLLFALPIIDGDSEIRLVGKLESKPYIDLTVDMLSKFGIKTDFCDNVFYITGNQRYKSPGEIEVEGDWSNAAFWLAAGVSVTGLDINSKQGDRAIIEILENWTGCINAADIPDLVPILAVVAAEKNTTTVIKNAKRLRLKESDRLSAVTEMLTALGVSVQEKADGLVIHGGKSIVNSQQSIINCHNDHRIAMSAAIAALTLCSEPVIIKAVQAVEKSYPQFFDDLRSLGGKWEEI